MRIFTREKKTRRIPFLVWLAMVQRCALMALAPTKNCERKNHLKLEWTAAPLSEKDFFALAGSTFSSGSVIMYLQSVHTNALRFLCEINQCPCAKLHVNKDVGFRLLNLFRFDSVIIKYPVNRQKMRERAQHFSHSTRTSSHTCCAHTHPFTALSFFFGFRCSSISAETKELKNIALHKMGILKMTGIEEDVIYALIFKVQKVDIHSRRRRRRRCLPFTRTCVDGRRHGAELDGLHMGAFYFRTWSVWCFGWFGGGAKVSLLTQLDTDDDEDDDGKGRMVRRPKALNVYISHVSVKSKRTQTQRSWIFSVNFRFFSFSF